MDYIASISYGKDSLAMLEIIKQHNMPLDRIVHAEIMATKTIPADLPPMMEFKKKADVIIKERYGIEVERVQAEYSYEDYFYKERKSKQNCGKMYGFPIQRGSWCNTILKMGVLNKVNKKDVVQYVGIASDEPNRFHNLSERKISPLVEYDITEAETRIICKDLDLLSPIYSQTLRGGCWFCHNQTIGQLRLLRENYPEYWELMKKWSKDSPTSFKDKNKTIALFEKRFSLEDKGLIDKDEPFRWTMLNEELNYRFDK